MHLSHRCRSGDNYPDTGFNTLQIYTISSNTWQSSSTPGSTLRPLPARRGGMGPAVFMQGELYVFGGETTDPGVPNGVYKRVDVYRVSTNTWRRATDMPKGMHGINPVSNGQHIFIAGGGDVVGGSQTNNVFRFQPPN